MHGVGLLRADDLVLWHLAAGLYVCDRHAAADADSVGACVALVDDDGVQQNILDPDYANAAAIDTDAQRAAWVASGKSEAADWDDDAVKANPFKRTVYLTANVKILGSMTDLIMPITMA